MAGALALGLTLGCRAPAADVADAAWWAALAQPPPASSAWPLAALVGGGPELAGGHGGWRLERGAEDAAEAVCHAAGGAPWRAVPGVAAADDVDVRVRARTEPSAGERYGVAVHLQDADNYYLARVDTRNNNVRLYRRQGGTLSLLAARDLGVSVGQWHDLAVRAHGARLAVALDGEPLLQATDDALSGGAIGLWADAQARACFAGLWLTSSGAP